jgi:hypothetical protein
MTYPPDPSSPEAPKYWAYEQGVGAGGAHQGPDRRLRERGNRHGDGPAMNLDSKELMMQEILSRRRDYKAAVLRLYEESQRRTV